jgi:cytochrome c oxidase cbb3-type subunit 2
VLASVVLVTPGIGVALASLLTPGNAAVNDANPTTHIRTVLYGLQGANVGGVVYSSPMPAFGDTLSDGDIANIVNYERSSWGNHGAPVTAEQVAAEHAKGK